MPLPPLAAPLLKAVVAIALMASGASQAQQVVADGVYRLVAAHSGQALNILQGAPWAGAAAGQWPWTGSENSRWNIRALGGGEYVLTAQHSGQALDVAGCNPADGARVQQWTNGGSACQVWRIESLNDGTYRLVNRSSGKVLDVQGASQAGAALAVQWGWTGGTNQRWRIERVSPNAVAAGTYGVTSAFNGLAMDVAGISTQAGATVFQWTPVNGANQKWRVIPTADGFFELAPTHAPTMRLELAGSAQVDGTSVRQGLANGSPAQRWAFTAEPDGSWRISNRDGTKVLDTSFTQANGSSIVQWFWWGGTNQRWKLAPSPVSGDCAAQRGNAGYDVVLLMGQSNMSGYGWGYDAAIDGVQDARIQQWARGGGLVAASETLQQADWGLGSTRVGMGTSFARSYLATLPGYRGVLLVPTAYGGTGLVNGPWSPGGNLYEDAVGRLSNALASNAGKCVAAVLWHQGENDIGRNVSSADYEATLKRMLADLRSRVPRSARAPFLMGEMTQPWIANPGLPQAQVQAIVSALQRVAASTPNTAFVPSAGLTVNPGDIIHFDAPAMRAYGQRYFETLNQALERR
jgi:hypothetical protein